MAAVITKEVDLARRLGALRKDLEMGLDYSTMASFRSVDKFNSGVITTVNLGAFMREHGHFASETELLAIVRRLDTDGDASITYGEWTEFLRTPVALPAPLAPLPPPVVPPRPLPSYYYSRYYDWRYDLPYSRYWDDWRYDSSLSWKYDWPYRYYSAYSPYYSRYYSPYWSRYGVPPETKTVTYDVEKPTPYSPTRTVKRETYHSPVHGSRTYTSYL